MKNLNKQELKKVYGGGFNFGIVALIGAGITFIIGIIDFYYRNSRIFGLGILVLLRNSRFSL